MLFTISHNTTRVKIIVAPVGIPAKNEIVYPAAVPINPEIRSLQYLGGLSVGRGQALFLPS
jgi:hypothetical protein